MKKHFFACLVLMGLAFAGPSFSQTQDAPADDFTPAYFVLKDIEPSYSGDSAYLSDFNNLANRIVSFYINALHYGKTPSNFYDIYESACSDETKGSNSELGCSSKTAFAEYAEYYQCTQDPKGPANIVADHFNHANRRFFITRGITTKSPSAWAIERSYDVLSTSWHDEYEDVRSAFTFFVPRPLEPGPSDSVWYLPLDAYRWYPNPEEPGIDDDFRKIAYQNTIRYQRYVNRFTSEPWLMSGGSASYTPTVWPTDDPWGPGFITDRFVPFSKANGRLVISSVNDKSSCVYDAERHLWKKVFHVGVYSEDGSAYSDDPPLTFEENGADANEQSSTYVGADYTAPECWDCQVFERNEDGSLVLDENGNPIPKSDFLPPGYTAEEWAASPNNPLSENYKPDGLTDEEWANDPRNPRSEMFDGNGDGIPDALAVKENEDGSVDNDDLPEVSFCVKESQDGDCIPSLTMNDLSGSFGETTNRLVNLTQGFFDFSALQRNASCPSWDFDFSIPVVGRMSHTLEFDCDALETYGDLFYGLMIFLIVIFVLV